jgi:hypothetical protein
MVDLLLLHRIFSLTMRGCASGAAKVAQLTLLVFLGACTLSSAVLADESVPASDRRVALVIGNARLEVAVSDENGAPGSNASPLRRR